jgi:zinc protease
LGTDAANDYFVVSLKTVSADFVDILGLTSEIIRTPTFPDQEIELERQITIQGIRSQREQPFPIAFEQLRLAMYKDHPYAISTLGTEETVAQLSKDDLQAFHATYFRPDRMIVSLAGKITNGEAVSLIGEFFGDWQIPQESVQKLSLPALNSHPQKLVTPQETQQSVVMLGYLTPKVNHPDYPVLKLVNSYLGNGLSSRLFVELREKRGLAYDVSAMYPTRLDQSQFVAYIGTAPENTQVAIEGLQVEIDRLVSTELSDYEVESAKNKLLGQYALGKQTNSQIAQVFGWYETLGLGIQFDTTFQEDITLVTSDKIQEVVSKYFIKPYISVVGPTDFVS